MKKQTDITGDPNSVCAFLGEDKQLNVEEIAYMKREYEYIKQYFHEANTAIGKEMQTNPHIKLIPAEYC
jgi:hypothetical protein